MAFTLVQKSVAVANNSAGSVTGTLPGGSTAGNTLIACPGSNVAATQFTAPANWVQAAQISNGTLSRSEIWYLPSCPAGITSAVFTCGTGQVRVALAEFHSSVAGATVTVDVAGTGTASAVTTCTATGSGTAGDLIVTAFFEHLGAAAVTAWTDPAGYTLLGSNTASNQNPLYSAYKLSAAGGAISVIGTSNQTAGPNGWTGCVVSFKEVAAGGLSVTTTSPMPGGTVGLPYNQTLAAAGGSPPYTWSISAGSLPAGTSLAASGGRGGLSGITVASGDKPSPTVVTANWEALTGINCTGRKCYFQVNPDGSGIFPTTAADNTIQDCLNNNLVLYLCVKPALNPPTVHDYNGLQASVTAMQNLGLTVKVIIWQEVEDQVSSPVLYKAGLVFYAGAVHAPGALLCHDSAGSKHLLWASFFPSGPSAAVVDEYMIDFYANTYNSGTRIDPFMAMAAATGKRVGVGEMGSSLGNSAVPPDTGPGSVTEYLHYVNGFAAALPPGLYAWYQQQNKNVNNIITDPSDFRIPLLQAIDATIAGGGTGGGAITGTPTTAAVSSFTARATDTNSVTATAALSITIHGATVLTVATSSLHGGTTGTAYSAALTATGGTPPYTWAVTAGALPAGLSLSSAGAITGTPSGAGTSTFTAQVTDAVAATATRALSITITATAVLTITTSSLPDGSLGTAYSAALTATAGTPPYTWAVTAGALPPGLALSAAGTISGTPSLASGTPYAFTVQATDAVAATATAALTINVTGSGGAPAVTTTSLPAAAAGVAYPLTALTETGGTAPFTWAVTSGALPDGLTLGPLGFIFGTPTAAAATSGFTVTVTDANSLTASQALFITVPAAAVLYGATYGAIYGTAAVPPPSPVPPPPRWPQLIIEAGLQPAAPQVPPGTFILDDPVYGQLSEGNQLGDSTTWTDITAFARTATLSRTSTRVQGPLLTYQAGTGSVTLKNGDGRFDPDNAASPYAGSIRPMIPFRARAVYGSVSYPIWSGFADSWSVPGTNLGPNYTETTVSGSDGFKILAGVTIPAGGSTGGDGDGEDSGARVTRILNAAGWYTDHRRVAVGDSPVQGTNWGDTALNLLQLTADSEIGELYIDGGGFLVFRNRQAILEDARSAQVQAVFGDAPGTAHGALTELPYLGVVRADDDTQLSNDVQATSAGGTLQEAQSLTSQRKYLFPRTYARSDLLLMDDPTTLEWAQWVLSVSLAGDDRFDALTVSPLRDPGLWPHVLGREIGDRVTVIRRPPGGVGAITQDCFIRGITHTIDASAATWQTQWDLQSAGRYTGFLILDDPTFGLLGTGKLAF
jgi:hypothetical protein